MKRYLLISLLLCLFVSPVFASYISLNTSVTAKVVGNQLKVLVTAVNKGDEAAYSVQAELRAGGKKILAEKVQKLGVNQTYKGYATFNLKLDKAGHYPLVIVMHYADANQYPFSALTIQTFAYKAQDMPRDLFGRMKATTFWENGSIELTLKNSSNVSLKAKADLVVPKEITVLGNVKDITLAARVSDKVRFDLENFSALSGSNYQVYAVSEYNKDNLHYTVITPGMIKIMERKSLLGIDYQYLLVFLIVLVVVFILFQVFKSEKK